MISESLVKAVGESQTRANKRAALEHTLRIQEAMDEVQWLIQEFCRRDPELRRVVLFGSLVGGMPRNPDFDIDLSFEGRELYACTAIALKSRFKVDLVDYRSLPEFMQEVINAHGKILYEADS